MDLKILGVRVLIVYTLTYVLSLAITAIIAQKYYHEDIKIKEDIRETIETILGSVYYSDINSIRFNGNSNKYGK